MTSVNDVYLEPIIDSNKYDIDLDDLLNEWITNISGIPEYFVRPLWQTESPKIPEPSVDWCSFGVSEIDDESPFFDHGEDDTDVIQNEEIAIHIRFYGHNAQRNMRRFKTGISIPQNNHQLKKLGLTIFRTTKPVRFPELLNNQWFERFDVTVYLRRRTNLTYQIKSLKAQNIEIIGDK